MSEESKFEGATVPASNRPGQFRCSDLWLPDGSIILQAENILFRVYSGLLSLHSPFFRDLFSLPQPPSQDMYEGIPVVQMLETANDLRYFLLAEQNPISMPISGNTDLRIVLSLLRLGTKYDVPHLKESTISVLEHIFPSTLGEWDETDEIREELNEQCWPWDFMTANSAREHLVLHILPAALLECSTFKLQAVVDGQQFGDTLYNLNFENKRAVILANPHLHHINRTQAFRFLHDHLTRSRSCATKDDCRRIRMEIVAEHDEEDPSMGMILIPSHGAFSTLQVRMKSDGYCGSCIGYDKIIFHEEREEIWKQLPSLFGLPDWDALRPSISSSDVSPNMEIS